MRLLFQYIVASDIQPVDGSVWDIVGAVVVTVSVLLPALWQLIKQLLDHYSHAKDTREEKETLLELEDW